MYTLTFIAGFLLGAVAVLLLPESVRAKLVGRTNKTVAEVKSKITDKD